MVLCKNPNEILHVQSCYCNYETNYKLSSRLKNGIFESQREAWDFLKKEAEGQPPGSLQLPEEAKWGGRC